MSLTLTELAGVVTELAGCLPGSRVDKISAPTSKSCQITLRGGGHKRILHIDLAPGLTRLHLVDSRETAPGPPPAWIMKCRAELSGKRLQEIAQLCNDRIVRMDFGLSAGEQAGRRTLIAELFGRGRLLLLDQRDSIIHPLIGKAEIGVAYNPPAAPASKGRPEACVRPVTVDTHLVRAAGTPNQPGPDEHALHVSRDGCVPPADPAEPETCVRPVTVDTQLDRAAPTPKQPGPDEHALHVSRDGCVPPAAAAADPETLAASRSVAERYAAKAAEQALAERRRTLTSALERELAKLRILIGKLRADLERSGRAADLFRQAEALKAGLHRARRGMSSIELPDYSDPDTDLLTIPLDKASTPVENMEKLFARARRLERGRAKIEPRLAECIAREKRLIINLDEARRASSLSELEKISPAPGRARAGKKQTDYRRKPYKSFLSKTGRTILVGRSATDNHQLTFRIARGFDMWLHARNRPGAHVVVRLAKNEQIDEQSLLDAATLSAAAAGLDEMEVAYTRVKNLRPVKGQPGLVSLNKERTMVIRVEPERLERLKKSRQE